MTGHELTEKRDEFRITGNQILIKTYQEITRIFVKNASKPNLEAAVSV
jgi:hypothetical protein